MSPPYEPPPSYEDVTASPANGGAAVVARSTERAADVAQALIGSVQRSEISPALSGEAREQAEKHVKRIEEIIDKLAQFTSRIEDVQRRGVPVTNNTADLSVAREAMETLRNAWADGSLKGSSRVGMRLGHTEADQKRKEREHNVEVAISRLVIQADADFNVAPGRGMAGVVTAAQDISKMPM